MDNKKLQVSWLVSMISVGVLAGAHISRYIDTRLGIDALVLAVALIGVVLHRRTRRMLLFACVTGILIGFWRAGVELDKQAPLSDFVGKTIVVSGEVAEDPSLDIDGDIRLRVRELLIDNRAYAGELWLVSSDEVQIKRSDRITAEGELSKGFGTIPAAMYRADISAVERQDYADVGREVRDWFAEGIREAVDEPEASLGSGFLLGQKTDLPEKLAQELQLLGLTHVIVASGFNLTILVRFARRLFLRISRFSALALSMMLVFGFIQMTGYSPSMTRAGLITFLSLMAWYFGRKLHPFVLIPFAAAVTVVVNPTYAWGDIGWLLSFASFTGVLVLSPLLHAYFWGDAKPSNVRQILLETISAQALTLPIIAYVFGQYSVLSLPANLLIVPFIPLAMLLVFIAGLAGVLFPIGIGVAGFLANVMLRYMTFVVDKLAALPQALGEVTISLTFAAAYYVIMAGLLLYLQRRTEYDFRSFNIIE